MHTGELIIVTIVTVLALFATYLMIKKKFDIGHKHFH
jgi:hypothetical protein